MRPGALASALLLSAGTLSAHDFWIEPSTFRPQPGTTVALHLRVGQDLAGDVVPRTTGAIEQFVVRQADSETPIDGIENTDPAGWLRADGRSTAVIAYTSRGAYLELSATRFEEYLRAEGLEHVLRARAERGQGGAPGRETFFRYAKALLTGQGASAVATRPLGLRYEIVPDDDPTQRPGLFRAHVLYAGQPLTNALVVAIPQSDPPARLMVRSDGHGAVSFALPHGGVWLVKSVHVVSAWFFSRADWESLWASLIFESPHPGR
jgi:Domain of unknown function (DUF4198)